MNVTNARKQSLSYAPNELKLMINKRLLTDDESRQFLDSIPEDVWQQILTQNFNGNQSLARRVLEGNVDEIKRLERANSDKEKRKIDNYNYAVDLVDSFINDKKPILFLTDFDNDGSLSQSIINEYVSFEKLNALDVTNKNLFVEYIRTVNGNNARGVTFDVVEDIINEKNINVDEPFLIVTTDNGINSNVEIERIKNQYPNANILITDHHQPNPNLVVKEDERTTIFNPKYKASIYQDEQMKKERGNRAKTEKDYEYFDKWNISGANVIGVILKGVLEKRFGENGYKNDEHINPNDYRKTIDVIDNLSYASNMLDYVDANVEDQLYDNNQINAFLGLASPLNTNNDLSNMIVNGLKQSDIDAILAFSNQDNPMNEEKLKDVSKSIFALNKQAQILLTIQHILLNIEENKDEKRKDYFNHIGFNNLYVKFLNNLALLDFTTKDHFVKLEDLEVSLSKKSDADIVFSSEVKNEKVSLFDLRLFESNNENYIGQLRPYIFSLLLKEDKNEFENMLLNKMTDVFTSLKKEENILIEELRKGDFLTNIHENNVIISLLDSKIIGVLNRKILSKAFNNINPSFSLILDDGDKKELKGSFRSQIDIDLITNSKDFKDFCEKEGVVINIAGHKRAAGFAIHRQDGGVVNVTLLKKLAKVMNEQIQLIKDEELKQQIANQQENANDVNNESHVNMANTHIISDAYHLDLISDFNNVIRGQIPFNYYISPLLEITPDMVYVDQKTNKQYTIEEILENKSYGYVPLKVKISKNGNDYALIVSTELLRQAIKDGSYIQFSYMSDGAFIGNNVVAKEDVKNAYVFNKDRKAIDLVTKAARDGVFDNDTIIQYTREDLMNNPFFKFNSNKEEDFKKFENLVINILNSTDKERYVTFDVEANGFSNAQLINIGALSLMIDPSLQSVLKEERFKAISCRNYKDDLFLITDDNLSLIEPSKVTQELKENIENVVSKGNDFYLIKDKEKALKVENHYFKNGHAIFNQKIKGEGIYKLVQTSVHDFQVPLYMTYLTGITTAHCISFGESLEFIDDAFVNYFDNRKGSDNFLFGCHNTSYDLKIVKTNMPKFYELCMKNQIFDTCSFSKKERLAYADIETVKFQGVPEIPNNVIFFNEAYSDVNLIKFILERKGEYPDRTGENRLSFKEDGELYFISNKGNEVVSKKISVNLDDLASYVMPKDVDKDVKKMEKAVKDNDLDVDVFEKSLYVLKEVNVKRSENGFLEKQEIPLNYVKYSAQELGNEKMIRNLLLDNVKEIKPNIIEVKKELKDMEVDLIKFQLQYNFSISLEANIENLEMKSKAASHGINYFDMVQFGIEFLNKNVDLTRPLANSWYYKQILTKKDPNHTDLNKATYESISKETGFSPKIVEKVLRETCQFKQKYGIKNFIQKEPHANGVENGDVIYESIASLNLLATKKNLNVGKETALKVFLKEANDFNSKIKRSHLIRTPSEDSMGFTQLSNYSNNGNLYIKNALDKKRSLENGDKSIVRFGLGDTLPQDVNIVAITREDVPITIEQIREDANKLKFVNQNIQANCFELKNVLESNEDKIKAIREDLGQRYTYLSIDHGDKELNKVLEIIYEKKITKKGVGMDVYNAINKSEAITQQDITMLKNHVEKELNEVNKKIGFYKAQESLNEQAFLDNLLSMQSRLEEASVMLIEIERERVNYKTMKEVAFEHDYDFMNDKQDENAFLENQAGMVVRRDPMEYAMKHFDFNKLTQEYTCNQYEMESPKLRNKMSIKFN